MTDNDKVNITFDPSTGKFEFSAPGDKLQEAAEQAKVLIQTVNACLLPQERRKPALQPDAETQAAPAPDRSAKSPRKFGESSARLGRIGAFEKVDFGLSEAQERAIFEFYSTRRPKEQQEQVVVAMYIGSKVLNRSGFNFNEIYTLLHLGGERELPKAVDVVMGRLAGINWVSKAGKLYSLKFQATDFVDKLSSEAA